MTTEVVPVPGIEALPFAVALREDGFLLGCIQAVHLIGVALLAGPVIAFDLRLLGLNKHISVEHLARHLLPLAVAALVLIVPTGLAMFAAHAPDYLANRIFALKMLLFFLGGVLAIVFHTGPYRSVSTWPAHTAPPWPARACAAASLGGWCAVIVCGALLR